VEPRAPGILIYGAGQAIAQNSDFTLNSPTNPAATGSFVTVYLAGLGALDNPVATGASAPSAPLSNALATVSATLGGTTAKVTFAGLTPGFVGLAQVNVQIPNLAPGNYSLIITAGSDASSPATLSITGGAAASPQFLMSSVVGDGVTGSPLSTSSFAYAPGAIVNYNFSPASGYSAAVVEIDGTVSPNSGTIKMNSDHWLWAFGQPQTGTDFPATSRRQTTPS
jgi:hypothetical protein